MSYDSAMIMQYIVSNSHKTRTIIEGTYFFSSRKYSSVDWVKMRSDAMRMAMKRNAAGMVL